MGFFDNPEERQRKANLKKLEDKRVAFAQQLAREGFAPEKMLFAQTMNGGYVAICRFENQHCLFISPSFGGDEDFVLERYDALDYRVEQVNVKAEGMGGIFGFGKRGQTGVEYVITRADGSEVRMPFVAGRNGWLECTIGRNPLLKTQRRRGDANVAWDFKPLDTASIKNVLRIAERYFPA